MYSLSFTWLYNYIYILLIQIIIFLKIRRYNPKKENDLFDMLEKLKTIIPYSSLVKRKIKILEKGRR